MIIEFELENNDFCGGCPCLNAGSEWGTSCNLNYFDACNAPFNRIEVEVGKYQDVIIRPNTCKKQYDDKKNQLITNESFIVENIDKQLRAIYAEGIDLQPGEPIRGKIWAKRKPLSSFHKVST